MRWLVLVLCLALLASVASAAGVSMTGVSQTTAAPAAVFSRSTGLQTNTVELDRFVALSGSGLYASDRTAVSGHATTARDSWPYTITAGAWESDAGVCEPVGATQTGSEYEVSYAATDIWAMALSGYIEGGTTSLYSAARTRLLEMTAITDFEAADISGGNQCILDLGAAAAHLVEAALLLEDAGYSGWTNTDRQQLANWLAAEVFPLVSWGIDARKNNWGSVTFASALAIAAYANGGISLLTKHDATTVSPSAYLSGAGTPLAKWLSTANGDELDSTCQDAGQVFGLQSHGGFPDELRRSVGTDDCPEASLAFDCPTPSTCGASTFYQQKTTAALAHVCEILRRIDGSGARCFNLTSHGGNDEALYDAAQFASGSTFQSYQLDDTTQGYRYVAGEYYADAALKAALDSGSVSVRGGRDYAYTRITHAPEVAYVSPPATGSCADGVDCYCDRVSGAGPLGTGDPLYRADRIFCEDYEDERFYENVAGGWIDGAPGDGGLWNRGVDALWFSTRGSSDGQAMRYGDGVPTLGQRCEFGPGAPSPGNGYQGCAQAEYCSLAQGQLAGAGRDCWGPGANGHAGIDMQRSGDFDDEVATLTLTGGYGVTSDIGAGDQHMAYRVGEGNTQGILGATTWTATTSLGIIQLRAYSSNASSASGINDPWKDDEFGDCPYCESTWMGNVGIGDGGNVFPFSPIMFLDPAIGGGAARLAACNAAITAPGFTLHVGQIGCNDIALEYGATNGTGTGQYDQATDWPFGQWRCARGYVTGMGTSSMAMKIWIGDELIIHFSGFDGTVLSNKNYDNVAWNAYANSNQGLGESPTTATIYRYQDNLLFTTGEPPTCAASGY